MTELLIGDISRVREYYEKKVKSEYFCFELGRENSVLDFMEIERFCWESKHQMTRFKNRYTGPVLIDLTQWNEYCEGEEFEAFLYYLKDHQNYSCTFTLRKRASKELTAKLEQVLETKLKITSFIERDRDETKRSIGFTVCEEGKDNEKQQ